MGVEGLSTWRARGAKSGGSACVCLGDIMATARRGASTDVDGEGASGSTSQGAERKLSRMLIAQRVTRISRLETVTQG